MATQADLDVAIAKLESKVTDMTNEVMAKVQELKDIISQGADTQPQIDRLAAIEADLQTLTDNVKA
jgi:hypothetical protein